MRSDAETYVKADFKKELNSLENNVEDLDFLKMNDKIMNNGLFRGGLSGKAFVFDKGFEKVNPYTQGKYIDIDGRIFKKNNILSKYYTGLGYRIGYNNSREDAGYLYVGQLEKNKFSGEGVCYWNNGNKYRGNRENHKPTTGKVEFNNKEYDVVHDEGKGLKIISDGENKNKHIKLMTGEIAD